MGTTHEQKRQRLLAAPALLEVQKIALARALSTLNGIGAVYKIILPDRTEYGDRIVTMGATHEQKRQRLLAACRLASISIEQQRLRMLTVLKCGPVSTTEAREKLNVIHPASRVKELRAQGHCILATWTYDMNELGRLQRIARYILLRDRGRGAD